MKKKEFKVGEVFQCGLIKLKCVKDDNSCDHCYFKGVCKYEVTGGCCSEDREDKTNVVFVKVEDKL